MGTIRKNKTCVQKEFLPNRSRLEFPSLFGFQKNCTLVSYVSKTRKVIILSSTMHHAPNVTSDEIMKPEIILDYDQKWLVAFKYMFISLLRFYLFCIFLNVTTSLL